MFGTATQKYKGLSDGKYCDCLDISVANNAAQTYGYLVKLC